MSRRVLQSRIGEDGVLRLDVPFGAPEAGRDVCVTVESVDRSLNPSDWRNWVLASAGSWQGEFTRPNPGEFENRDPLS